MLKRIVVKVGTSLLTHANGQLNLNRVEAIVRQIADLHADDREVILVTSGAVGAGLGRLGFRERTQEVAEKQALAAVGQGVLMHLYEKFFAEYGQTVAQILLTREDFDHPVRSENARAVFALLLRWSVVPIVNENDTVANDEIREITVVGDNDTLSARVAVLAGADLLVILSDIDGLYPADPRTTPGLKPLTVVEEITPALSALAGGTGSANATGGMRTKIQAAATCLGAGIPMVIASGHQAGVLAEIMAGRVPGTLFRPRGLAFGVAAGS